MTVCSHYSSRVVFIITQVSEQTTLASCCSDLIGSILVESLSHIQWDFERGWLIIYMDCLKLANRIDIIIYLVGVSCCDCLEFLPPQAAEHSPVYPATNLYS